VADDKGFDRIDQEADAERAHAKTLTRENRWRDYRGTE
jgi:hypothetical protein